MNSTIRLFKVVPITKKGKGKADKEFLRCTIEKGFIFSPEVIANYSGPELVQLANTVAKEVGLDSAQMNSSFHKSWKKVKESTIFQLVIEQCVHYLTTYGYEAWGTYDQSTVYIPTEKLELPKIHIDKVPLVVIHGLTKEELKSRLIDFLRLGVALKDDTKRDVIDVATFVVFTQEEVEAINNKEVKVCLFDYLGMIPKNPVEFLRYMIYKSTNRTLIIKNKGTVAEIKSKDNLAVLGLLEKYEATYGLERLAEIFYRFKPLFLAFRTSTRLKVIINKLRKLACDYHKPMKEDLLNNVTTRISNKELDAKELKEALKNASVFRKVRLAYALKFRTGKRDSILYRVRNGKSYAKEFTFEKTEEAKKVLKNVLTSIAEDVAKNVKGKKIYLPDNINYTLPATEKQFTGDIPAGSYVVVPKDIILGVHWENLPGKRVDLDLSMMNVSVGKIGWDGYYRNASGDVLFSGDVTDAPKPHGASELFYVAKQKNDSFLLMLNNFTYHHYYSDLKEVPFKIIIASEPLKSLNHNYMVNPNNVVCTIKSKIGDTQKTLGLLVTTPEENRFYFAETVLGSGITSYNTKYTEHSRKYLLDYYQNSIGLREVLEEAGAKIVKNTEKCDIDLSPENMQKDTILSLFKKDITKPSIKVELKSRIKKLATAKR